MNALAEKQPINGEDIERSVSTSYEDVGPLIRGGAEQLIAYHRSGSPVLIKSWGTVEIVHEEISEQLMSFGYSEVIAHDMAEELVNYTLENAATFEGTYNANIIAVKLQVDEIDPDSQFETGALETRRITGRTTFAEVVGATDIERHTTISGSKTSSNRADIDAMFASTKEWSLWMKFEAPDKEELKGVSANLVSEALGAMASPDITPEELAALTEKIEILAAEGLIADELAVIIEELAQVKALAEGLSASDITPQAQIEIEAQISALKDDIVEQLTTAIAEGVLPADTLAVIAETLNQIAQNADLPSLSLSANELSVIEVNIQKAVLVQALSNVLAESTVEINQADQAAIESIIAELTSDEGGEPLSQEALAEITATLESLESIEAVGTVSTAIAQVLSDLSQAVEVSAQIAQISAASNGVDLTQAEGILLALQNLQNADASEISPALAELKALVDGADIDALTVEQIQILIDVGGTDATTATHATGTADSALNLEGLLVELAKDSVQAELPAAIQSALPQAIEEATPSNISPSAVLGASASTASSISPVSDAVQNNVTQNAEVQAVVQTPETVSVAPINDNEIASVEVTSATDVAAQETAETAKPTQAEQSDSKADIKADSKAASKSDSKIEVPQKNAADTADHSVPDAKDSPKSAPIPTKQDTQIEGKTPQDTPSIVAAAPVVAATAATAEAPAKIIDTPSSQVPSQVEAPSQVEVSKDQPGDSVAKAATNDGAQDIVENEDAPVKNGPCETDCNCHEAFKVAAENIDAVRANNKDADYEELKKTAMDALKKEDVSSDLATQEKAVRDVMKADLHQMGDDQKEAFTKDIAAQKFGGDEDAAREYVAGHVEYRKYEEATKEVTELRAQKEDDALLKLYKEEKAAEAHHRKHGDDLSEEFKHVCDGNCDHGTSSKIGVEHDATADDDFNFDDLDDFDFDEPSSKKEDDGQKRESQEKENKTLKPSNP